jgi:hypothetical protein
VDRIRADIPVVLANHKLTKDWAYARGKEYECYEGGFENVGNNMQKPLQRSPLVYQLMIDYLDAFAATIGGPGTLHLYTLERSGGYPGGYGLREVMGQSRTETWNGLPPAYKYDAVLNKIAALRAAA